MVALFFVRAVIELPVLLVVWTEQSQGSSDVDESATVDFNSSSSEAGLFEVAAEFHTYVRPSVKHELSTFCTQLTGVNSDQIKTAPAFPEALMLLHCFLAEHGLLMPDGDAAAPKSILQSPSGVMTDPEHPLNRDRLRSDTIWCTHGPFDLRDFIPKQCWISGFLYGPPRWLQGPILDIRKAVSKWKQQQRQQMQLTTQPIFNGKLETALRAEEISQATKTIENSDSSGVSPSAASASLFLRDGTIPALLADLDLGEFQGRLHNGLDDIRNLARILIDLGVKVVNEMRKAENLRNDAAEPSLQFRSDTQGAETSTKALTVGAGCLTRDTAANERRFSASRLLEPNFTLHSLPPIPTHRSRKECGSSNRYYLKRYFWMGKRVGTVDWEAVEGDQAGHVRNIELGPSSTK